MLHLLSCTYLETPLSYFRTEYLQKKQKKRRAEILCPAPLPFFRCVYAITELHIGQEGCLHFVHVCRKCCEIDGKSPCKIVHHVGAGHARPAAYRHILFTIQSVGEGFIPPGHLSPPQASAAARGLAALRPYLKMRVGRGALTPPQFTGVSLLRFIRREKSCPSRGASGTPPPTIDAANLPPYLFPLHAPSVHFPKFIHFFVKKSTKKILFVL